MIPTLFFFLHSYFLVMLLLVNRRLFSSYIEFCLVYEVFYISHNTYTAVSILYLYCLPSWHQLIFSFRVLNIFYLWSPNGLGTIPGHKNDGFIEFSKKTGNTCRYIYQYFCFSYKYCQYQFYCLTILGMGVFLICFNLNIFFMAVTQFA